MSEHVMFRRKAMGRYAVVCDGSDVAEVRTTRFNRHWCWVVVRSRVGSNWRHRHFHSREEAAEAIVGPRDMA